MGSTQTIAKADTGQPADTCEFALASPVLAVGTYLHEPGESSVSRRGTLILYSTTAQDADSPTWARAATFETAAAVLDLKWAPHNQFNSDSKSHEILAMALADGHLEFWRHCRDSPNLMVPMHRANLLPNQHQHQYQTQTQTQTQHNHGNQSSTRDVLCTAVSWNPHDVAPRRAAASLSEGGFAEYDMEACAVTVKVGRDVAGPLETWTLAYDLDTRGVIYTGSDDGVFSIWDVRVSNNAGPSRKMQQYDVGVCAVAPHPRHRHVVAVGGYDEHISLLDLRMATSGGSSPAKPVATVERIQAPGGVWRIKWHPHNDNVFAAAAMYGGFLIHSLRDGNGNGDSLARTVTDADAGADKNKTHSQSQGQIRYTHCDDGRGLAYGVDWDPAGDRIATCSFYDQSVHLWRPGADSV